MGHPVTYDGYNPYASNGRAYADIWCRGIAKVSQPLHLIALIDTGADYLELPYWAAPPLGIDLYALPTSVVLTAGGFAPAVTVKGFGVEIQGKIVRVTAQFMSIPKPLLGLNAFLTAIDIGFDTKKWLFKK